MSKNHRWGSDVPVSKPKASADHPSQVNFGGFGFSDGGITFHATQDHIEEEYLPFFRPPPIEEQEVVNHDE